jgi:hypothetical protein
VCLRFEEVGWEVLLSFSLLVALFLLSVARSLDG